VDVLEPTRISWDVSNTLAGVSPGKNPGARFAGTVILSALASALASLVWSSPARGQTAPPDEPTSSERTSEEVSHRPRVGAIAGVGFPRPLSLEAMVKIDDVVGIGAEYGLLPSVTVDNLDTNLWSVAVDARVFPFRNAFFVGLRVGRQHVGASTAVTVASIATVDETLALDSWFLNPRIGLLWTGTSGLTIGAELGIQIPLSPSVTSSLPLALVPDAQRTANTLGKTVLPTINLLQIGMLF